ncbi:MAG: hypothetical protein ABIW76_07600 [Fibrobacteria bacterium]
MNFPFQPASSVSHSSFRAGSRDGRLIQSLFTGLFLMSMGSLLLSGCNRPYPNEPRCCRDDIDSRDYDYPYGRYPYDGSQSGSPADLPKGEREIGLVLDPGLRMWFDVYAAVPRCIFVGSGPDTPSSLAHDLREMRPWYLAYAGRSEPLYQSVSAWDHAGPTAHVRIRLDRTNRGNPLSIDLEIRHGYHGNNHIVIEAYQVHGLLDGESLVLQVGGEIPRGPWVQSWAAGGNGYLRGSVGHEELWMPGNGYHEARVEFR